MAANLPPVNHPELPEQPSEPVAKPDLMGYDSPEALVAAKRSSDAEAKRLADENRTMKEQLGQIMPMLAERANPAERMQQRDHYAALNEIGIPVGDLQEAIKMEARKMVRDELAPLVAAGSAREQMIANYPDFQKFEPQLNQFLQANPEVNEQYQWALRNASQNPKAAQMAMEWTYLRYGESERRNHGGAVQAEDTNPAPAAIPSSSSQDRSGQQSGDIEQMKRAFEYGQKFGDWRAYAHERLKGILPDSHFQ